MAPTFRMRSMGPVRTSRRPRQPRMGRAASSTAVLAGDGTFLGDLALSQLLTDHGIHPEAPIGAYCGSGVTASVTIAALAAMDHAGLQGVVAAGVNAAVARAKELGHELEGEAPSSL